MTTRRLLISGLLLGTGLSLFAGIAVGNDRDKATADSSSKTVIAPTPQDAEAMKIEGEKRFATNCGRCHQSPHKFPPRMVPTIVRHMRVRATITDEDMRYILFYMTQ